ncbi:MAG TPA: NADP-dependent oxidoreductase [Alphaproteobacteria bacterium]|nr:NADP-dependent oxidoreductase [Alphaproteobacteria bacterium]
MKAVRIHAFGGADRLQIDELPIPAPGEGEFLVRNQAAGVNPVDYKIRNGKYPAVREDKLPYVLGRDVAGMVEKAGPGSRFAEGDAIIAMPGIDRGGYAEYVLVKDAEATGSPYPQDHIRGGAIPLAALTAWQGLFRHGGVQAGQKILIHGGSGGVGHFAIQFAKAKGATVATTVSESQLGFVRELGADQAIDYRKQRFEDEVHDLDMVFDLIDGETRERSWGVLKPGGILVSTLTEPSQDEAERHGVRAMRYTVTESGADLGEIAKLIGAGRVEPRVAKVFALEDAAEAQRFLENEHPAGKVVLRIG